MLLLSKIIQNTRKKIHNTNQNIWHCLKNATHPVLAVNTFSLNFNVPH